MGWVTIDDFESGSFSANWDVIPNPLVVTSTTYLDGTYDVGIDTDHIDYVANTSYLLKDTSIEITRDTTGTQKFRYLGYSGNSSKNSAFCYSRFMVQDANNYYRAVISVNASTDNRVALQKIVSGTNTELSSHTFTGDGIIVRGIMIECTSTNITLTAYSDLSFTTSIATISTLDTTYSSGELIFDFYGNPAAGYGVATDPRYDNIQIWEEDASTGTNFQINIGDAWKEVSSMQINIGDTWKDVASAKINIGDAWKDIF